MTQIKDIDVLDKNIYGKKFHVFIRGRYLKKTSYLLTKSGKLSYNVSVLSN